MVALARDGEIVVADPGEASLIHNRGYYGSPLPGGALRLDLVEAAYLVDTGKLEVRWGRRSLGLGDLLRRGNAEAPGFEIRYLVYRDLRQRGYVVKPNVEPLDFRVFPRGGGPNSTPTKYWVAAISERAIFDLDQLSHLLDSTATMRKQLLLAVVDEESDLTYYRVSGVEPRGQPGARNGGPAARAHALFLEDRAVVVDQAEAAALYEEGFYGRMLGPRLQLSLLETAYLAKAGVLEVRDARTGRVLGPLALLRRARKIQPDLDLRLRVYEDLKARGIVVKTGFKYGSHFRGYEGDPDNHHARYLVHALPAGFRGMWPEVSRAVRLAHGVKKDILLGKVGEAVEYIRLQRVRP
jgi:tRNA-intron endonuclease